MNRCFVCVVVAVAGLGLLAPGAAAGEVHTALIESQADTVVSVKFVLSVKITFQGQTNDREVSGEATGIVVDPVGLVVMPTSAITPHRRNPMGMQGMEMKATPTSLRVVFPGDPEEYEAVLGATDSRLGLTFVRIKALEGKEIRAVDFSRTAEPKIGGRFFGVSRLDQGFDYAPYCDSVDVVGHVTKPRKMWLLQGRFTDVGHPLFTAEGAVVGFVVHQEGVGSRNRLPFLLPLKVAQSTIERAGREAEGVLEEALEGEQEEGAETEKPAEPDKPAEEGGDDPGAGAPGEPK